MILSFGIMKYQNQWPRAAWEAMVSIPTFQEASQTMTYLWYQQKVIAVEMPSTYMGLKLELERLKSDMSLDMPF